MDLRDISGRAIPYLIDIFFPTILMGEEIWYYTDENGFRVRANKDKSPEDRDYSPNIIINIIPEEQFDKAKKYIELSNFSDKQLSYIFDKLDEKLNRFAQTSKEKFISYDFGNEIKFSLIAREIENKQKGLIENYQNLKNVFTKPQQKIENLITKKITDNEKDVEYDFLIVKEHLKTLPNLKEKIKFLIEIKTDYLQNKSGWDIEVGTSFDKQCELEIDKLGKIFEIERITPIQTGHAFQLNQKKGNRTDLIRVLNAFYELKFIELTSGQIPSKELFMKLADDFFGVDLSNYESDLSQALNKTALEPNLKVFEDMKKVMLNSHYSSK